MAHTSAQALSRRRGVSLVEALVALVVMSIGMLALVGVQSTMRLNSDLAKQRTEATRIASEEIERLRSYTAMAAVPDTPGVSYDEIVSRVVEAYQPPDSIGNTSYRVERNVADDRNSKQKVVSVIVRWTDRTNQAQSVTMDSAISATDPVLSAMLIVPHRDSATSQRNGRHMWVPPGAVDQGNGTSSFHPPGSPVGVQWIFNNLSGEMTVNGVRASRVQGVIRFDLTATPSTGPPYGLIPPLQPGQVNVLLLNDATRTNVLSEICYPYAWDPAANPQDSCDANGVCYNCAITPADATGWGGQLNVAPLFSPDPVEVNICRYTSKDSDYVPNVDHPKVYCGVRELRDGEQWQRDICSKSRVKGKSSLLNQNFLVIRSDAVCPSSASAFTRQHQPTP